MAENQDLRTEKTLCGSAVQGLLFARKAYLWVLRENDCAIRFYEKNGFRFDGGEKTDLRAAPICEKRYSRAL